MSRRISGANRDIFTSIAGKLRDHGLKRRRIWEFLACSTDEYARRQRLALRIVDDALALYNKRAFVQELSHLAEVERHLRAVNTRQRDHVIHAVSTLLVGIYLNEELGLGVNHFRLTLATLLHDIAYPVEIGLRLIQGFEEHHRNLRRETHVPSPHVSFAVDVSGIGDLCYGESSLDLIGDRLTRWRLRLDPREVCAVLTDQRRVDHGVLGALMLMKLVDMLYTKHNPDRNTGTADWDYRYFKEDIVDICASVFLHNLKGNMLNGNKLHCERNSLAFLLRLADELQDWGRPGGRRNRQRPPTGYSISVDSDKLGIKVPHGRVSKMREAVEVFAGVEISVSRLRRDSP